MLSLGQRSEACLASGGRQMWTVLQLELGDQGLTQVLTPLHPCHLGPRQQVRGCAARVPRAHREKIWAQVLAIDLPAGQTTQLA